MYEKLIERLREYPDREETVGGYVEIDWQDLLDAADAIESLTAQLAALQAENAELREENGCLQHNVAAMQATLDQQAKNCEELLVEKDKRISRVEAERDVAKRDIESILRSCTCEMRHEFCVRCDEPDGCDSDDCHDAEWRGAQREEGQDGSNG